MLESIDYFPKIQKIVLNNRLSSCYGRYTEKENLIEINQKVFNVATKEQIKSLIIHELTHNLDFLLNGTIDYDTAQGHGESWFKIAEDVSNKLNLNINRYSDFHVNISTEYDKKCNHTYKCNHCGVTKTTVSKYKDVSLVRISKCICCGKKDFEYLFNGQYGFNMKTLEKIILYDK